MKYRLYSLALFSFLLTGCLEELKNNTKSALADVEGIHFHVALDGDDTADGSLNSPFATLKRAKVAVRESKQVSTENITVFLRGGRYEVSETVTFGLEDSGTADTRVTYMAYPNETPILSAGKEITEWKVPTSSILGLPEIAQPHVRVVDVPTTFRTLFDSDGILPRAKSKGFITKEGGSRSEILLPESAYKNWSSPTSLEVVIRPHHAWILNILPISEVNPAKKSLTTSIEATYSTNPLHFLPTTENCWIENAIEELDEPGEWVLQDGKLYLWPRNTSPVYYPTQNEVLKVEGKVDIEGAQDTPVRNLHFSGLTFMHGERYQLTAEDAGLQHDWDMLDKDNALVRFRGTEECSVQDCHFLHSGSGALRLDFHSIQNEVSGNHIEHIGGGGILLCGYGPGTKDVNHHNLISNNHIHHVGEIYWHSPGLFLWQSGENKVTNNLIHNTNYTALIISGCMTEFFSRKGRELTRTIRWHEIPVPPMSRMLWNESLPYIHTHDNLIENNEIHHAMEKLGDGNAIYIRGAGAGNHINHNYIHDLVAPIIMQCAIRTDGGQRDTIITNNIIHRCTSQGIMLKLNTICRNNIIADVIPSAPLGKNAPRCFGISLREGPSTGGVIEQNIIYTSESIGDFLNVLPPKKAGATEDRRGRVLASVKDTSTDKNLYFAAGALDAGPEVIARHNALGADQNAISEDPLFRDVSNGDFTLLPNSPALKLGFQQIDQSKMGLLQQ